MKDTYSIADLMGRYSCAKSTLHRMMNKMGYPKGGRTMSRRTTISGAAIYEWEKQHMPWLHPLPDQLSRMEEDEQWQGIKERHEALLAKEVKTPKPEVVKESQSRHDWYELQRIERRRIDKIKSRHGRKTVARVKP